MPLLCLLKLGGSDLLVSIYKYRESEPAYKTNAQQLFHCGRLPKQHESFRNIKIGTYLARGVISIFQSLSASYKQAGKRKMEKGSMILSPSFNVYFYQTKNYPETVAQFTIGFLQWIFFASVLNIGRSPFSFSRRVLTSDKIQSENLSNFHQI